MGRAEDLFARLEAGGEGAIDELIGDRKSEELFLDFKRSRDDGRGSRLSDDDRNNFGRAISGFGNSEGGVIVWGVECSRDPAGADLPSKKRPLADAHRFVSWLENAVSGTTVPPHPLVRSIPVGTDLAATLVPRSHRAPHQAVPSLQYLIRAGSSFVPAPHALLAGMFGLRPLPHVFHQFVVAPAKVLEDQITFELGILIRNQGPGIATDLYLNLIFLEGGAGGARITFEVPEDSWSGRRSFGIHTSLISRPDLRLPPEAFVQPLLLNVNLRAPFESGIRGEGMVGAGQSPPSRFQFKKSRASLGRLHNEILASHRAGTLTPDRLSQLPRRVFGVPAFAVEDEPAP
jgi:hypothetical protein